MADIFPYPSSGLAVDSYANSVNTPGLSPEAQFDAFKREFGVVLADSAQYILRINDMDDARFCRWMGQSLDGRKWSRDIGQRPFPWEGAADSRIWLIDETINDDVTLMMSALRRGRLQAGATNYTDAPFAQASSIVLNHMMKTQMRAEWLREMEFIAQWRQHIGAAVVQTDWYWQTSTEMATITMQDIVAIAQNDPDFIGMLQYVSKNPESLTPQDIQILGQLLQTIWPGIKDPQEALYQLQHTGSYSFPNPYIKSSRPSVFALAPFRDVFFPLNTWDLQKARWIVRRDLMNEVDLAETAEMESWDPEFYESMRRLKGQSVLINYVNSHRAQLRRNKDLFIDEFREMYEVFYAYYLTFEDGVRKPHVMPFHPSLSVIGTNQILPYEHGEMPFLLFRRDLSTRNAIESRGVADISEPAQNEVKTQRDSRTDRTSIATLPPLAKPLARGKTQFKLGPSVEVTEQRPGEVHFLELPPMDQTTVLVEQQIRIDHDRYFGKENAEVPESRTQRTQQRLVDGWLDEVCEVAAQIGKLCQQYMSPQEWSALCMSKGVQFHAMTREEIQKQFHVGITFDVRDLNMELVQSKMETIQIASQMDQTGTIDKDALVRWMISSADPVMADAILRPPQSVSQREINEEQDALVKISLGIQPPLPGPGMNYQLRMQVIQAGIQNSPKLKQLIMSDQVAMELLENRVKALQFQVQQQQNAQIGRVGAAPVLPGPQPNQP